MKPWNVLLSIAVLVATVPLVVAPSAAVQSDRTPENPVLKLRGLVNACQGHDPFSMAMCGSYITGFVAGSQAAQQAVVVSAVAEAIVSGRVAPTEAAMERAAAKLREASSVFCIRSEWTAGYVQAVVAQYGREHPQFLDEPTAEQMPKILAKAFPCSQAK